MAIRKTLAATGEDAHEPMLAVSTANRDFRYQFVQGGSSGLVRRKLQGRLLLVLTLLTGL
jgi:hypothetical protein